MKHGDIRQIMNEGMPTYRSPYDKGRLIVQFSVKFPEKIDANNVGQLEALLPPREVCFLLCYMHYIIFKYGIYVYMNVFVQFYFFV